MCRCSPNSQCFAAAEASGSEELGFFGSLAKRFEVGGWGMYPITVCLIFFIAITVDRFYALFNRASINKEAFMRGLKKHIYAGDLDKAISYVAGQKQTPLTVVVKAGLMNVPKGDAEVQAAMDEAALRENPKLEGPHRLPGDDR
jgi:biopolymer transport protein ExbB/TolQ